jgi:FkbM family methyltransferase
MRGLGRFSHRMFSTARLLKNWRATMHAIRTQQPVKELRLRNGVVITAPEEVDLAYLFYETWVFHAYSGTGYEIHDEDVVIDIGANIGVFSLYAASRGKNVRVFAYEPFPDNVQWMQKNLFDSGVETVRVFDKAVGGTICQRSLQVDGEWIKHHLTSEPQRGSKAVSVDCITLDEVFRVNNIETCHLLKLDCEGSELEILKNASDDILRRVTRIVGEQHYGDDTQEIKEFRAILGKSGFTIEKFEPASEGGQFSARRR